MNVAGKWSGHPIIRSGQLDKNGQLNGVGLVFYTDGDLKGELTEGQFVDDDLNGYGQSIDFGGDHYIGNFKNNELHGQGPGMVIIASM